MATSHPMVVGCLYAALHMYMVATWLSIDGLVCQQGWQGLLKSHNSN